MNVPLGSLWPTTLAVSDHKPLVTNIPIVCIVPKTSLIPGLLHSGMQIWDVHILEWGSLGYHFHKHDEKKKNQLYSCSVSPPWRLLMQRAP